MPRSYLIFATLIAFCPLIAEADIVTENTTANFTTGGGFVGQSFTTPAGGPWSNITFNWFNDLPPTTPVAPGSLFLLTQSYGGSPNGLSNATPGFLAQSISNAGGVYTFAAGVTLQPLTQYFAYMDGTLTSGLAYSFSNAYPGGNAYSPNSLNPNAAYQSFSNIDNAFRVQGQVAAVPEPATMGTFALLAGAVGIAVRLRRRAGA